MITTHSTADAMVDLKQRAAWKLFRSDTNDLLLDSVEFAASFVPRLIGLQFRKMLPPGHGLLLAPCSSVHTMFVRFPLDVYFLSTAGDVLEVHRDVAPWRVAIPEATAHAVLETNVGEMDIEAGVRLYLKSASAADLPRAAAFLCDQSGESDASPK